jgi:FkbM family methyltransferase
MKNFSENRLLWQRYKTQWEKLIINTRVEPIARWLWWEIRSLGRPRVRRESHRHMVQIINRVVKSNSNCVDIGCNKGHILWYMIKAAPQGTHFAFEPIPELAQGLQERFRDPNVHIYPIALGDHTGESSFFKVLNSLGRSGLRKQDYPQSSEVQTMTVKIDCLDNILPRDIKIDFIKIDTEGAEFMVLCGAAQAIIRNKPFIIFEHSSRKAATFGVNSDMVYDFIVDKCLMQVSLVSDWIKKKPPLNRQEFIEQAGVRHCDFLAHL